MEDRVVPAYAWTTPQTAGYWAGNERVNLVTRTDEVAIAFDPSRPETLDQITSDNGPLAGFTVQKLLTPTLAVLTDPVMTSSFALAERLAQLANYEGVTYASSTFGLAGTSNRLVSTDQVIVALKAGVTPSAVFAGDSTFTSWKALDGTPDQFLVTVAGGAGYAAFAASDGLTIDSRVAWATPNFYRDFERHFSPNDPLINSQWHLENNGQSGGTPGADASVLKAWDIVAGGSSSVTVAVLDNGIDLTHPDLAGNIFTNPGEVPGNGIDDDGNGWVDDVNGWDFTSNGLVGDNNPSADSAGDEHATAVAGVLAARGDNGIGGAGVAYNTLILPVRIFSGGVAASDANIASAIYYAAGRSKDGLSQWNAAQILNNSWGGGTFSPAIQEAFAWATAQARSGRGVISFVSAGNEGNPSLSFPANLAASNPGIVVVGASTDQDVRAGYSNYGQGLEVVAPSSGGAFGIVTTDRTGSEGFNTAAGSNGNYTSTAASAFGGTSAATPLVSGIAALILARDSNLSVAAIRGLIHNTTDYVGPDPFEYDATTGYSSQYGYGRVNAFTAVSGVGIREIQVLDTRTDVPDDSGTVSFGTAALGAGTVKIFRVRNQGTLPLTLGPISLTGPFVLVSGFGSTTLNVGESTTFVVRFLPTATGSATGTVSFATNDADEATFNFNLVGTGTSSSIAGTVFEDTNADSAYSPTEPGLAGRTVFLDANGNGVYDAVGSTPTFSSGALNTPIPDGNLAGLSKSITVAGQAGVVTDLNVTININHPRVDNLVVELIAPNGRIVLLANSRGGAGANYSNTAFDDEALPPIATGAAPFMGSYRPEQLLSAFDGLNPNGAWTLRVTDQTGGNVGALLNWSMTMSLGEIAATTDAAGAYSFMGLPAGTYNVATAVPSGWLMTLPADSYYSVILEANGSVPNRDFGLVQQGAIYGRVVDDQNADGTLAPSEPGLAGRTVYIDSNGNGQLDNSLSSQTFNSGLVEQAIPDNDANGLLSSITVAAPGLRVSDVNVTVNVAHASAGDLIVDLIAPDGTTVNLMNRRGGNGANLSGTVFDDTALVSIASVTAGGAPFSGSFRPEQLLAAFNGTSPNGAWKLRVRDAATGNTGTLQSWSLTMTFGELSTTTDASGNYKLQPDAGTHTLRSVVPGGWVATAPVGNAYAVELTSNGVVSSRDFGQSGNAAPPTAEFVLVTPDPRRTAVPTVDVVFSELVVGVDVGDFTLTRDNVDVPLTGVTISSSGTTYTLHGLASLTALPGVYVLKLTAAGSEITDNVLTPLAGNATVAWAVDTTVPTATLGPVSPDYRTSPVASVAVTFSEPVTGLDVGDLRLTRDGSLVPLSGVTITGSGAAYVLDGLTALTALDGNYTLTLIASSSAIKDFAGNLLAANASTTWTLDTIAPTANVADVTPTLRRTPVGSITVVFSEVVYGVDLGDFVLTRDGSPVSLDGAVLSGSGSTYTVSNLAGVTGSDGIYELTLNGVGTGISDLVGNPLSTGDSTTWMVDATRPTPDLIDVAPDPRTTPVSSISVVFSESVSGVDLGDFVLTRDEFSISLSAAFLGGSGSSYVISNLAGLTGTDGNYVLRLVAAGAGITDQAGNLLASDAVESWRLDGTRPTADVIDVAPDPRSTAVGSLTVVFSEAVTGVDLADFTLARNGVSVSLASATLGGSGASYTISNLAGLTSADGTYLLTLAGLNSGIADEFGNAYNVSAAETWVVDSAPPTADVIDVSPDPRNSAVGTISVVFNEAVTGFDLADLSFTKNGAPVSLAGATLTTADGITWTLGNLSSMTAGDGSYGLTLTATGSGIADLAGNGLQSNVDDSWLIDTVAPGAVVGPITPDPRNSAVDSVSILFGEPVTGFNASALVLTRNAFPVALSGLTITGSGTSYTVSGLAAVTGVEGTYSLTVLATAGITDVAGNGLAAPGSDSWSVDTTRPTASVAAVSPSPRSTPVASVGVTFTEFVTGLTPNDFTLTRDGTPVSLAGATVTGFGVSYTLGNLAAVTGASGTYVLTLVASGSGIADGVANLLAGNATATWTVDATGPTVSLSPVVPDPRTTPVNGLTVTFSEPVTGFDRNDLILLRNGVSVSLSSVTISGSGSAYTIGNLSALTAGDGSYVLSLLPVGSGIQDAAGNALTSGASAAWFMNAVPPTADVLDVSPNSRTDAVASVTINFSEPVYGFDASDLTLTRNGVATPTSTLTPSSSDGKTWVVSGLMGLNASDGAYVLTLNASGSGIADVAGTALTVGDSASWSIDRTAPTAALEAVSPNPRNSAVESLSVTFSENVVGVDVADFVLSFNGSPISLAGATVSGSGAFYVVSGLGSLTGADGAYSLTLLNGSGITDLAGVDLLHFASTGWLKEQSPPVAKISTAFTDVVLGPVETVPFDFSESVVGFDVGDLQLTRNSVNVPLAGVYVMGSGGQWVVAGLGNVTKLNGFYSLGLSATNNVRDVFGNPIANLPSVSWQTAAQAPILASSSVVSADPSRVEFKLVFSKPVTNFSTGGLFLGGTAGATSAAITQLDAKGDSYLVTLTGMTTSGTVELRLLPGAAEDSAGNPSLEYASPLAAVVSFPASSAPASGRGVSVGTLAVGADAGGQAVVRVYDPATNVARYELTVFDNGFTGGVRVATADFNRDGIDDVAVGNGPGMASLVRVLDGKTGRLLFSVQPFETSFKGGVYVAAGDMNGDGVAELVVTPDEGGGPVVAVYDATGRQVARFLGIDDNFFRGGARATVGDVNGDGVDDLVVAAGFGGGPRVAIFDGRSVFSETPTRLMPDFYAFEDGLRNGVFIAAGDLNGDGSDDLIFGGGPGGGPRIRIADTKVLLATGGIRSLDDAPAAQLANFFAGDEGGRGGVRVSAEYIDGDHRIDLVVGSGAKAGSHVARYAGKAIPADGLPPVLDELDAFKGFTGGVFVG